MASGVYGSFATNSLDCVPFKLSPQFAAPTKGLLPPEFDRKAPRILNEEYSFEVEEAVLKWSAERERQLEDQRKCLHNSPETLNSVDTNDETDSKQPREGSYENLNACSDFGNSATLFAEHTVTSREQKHKDTSVKISFPNPLLANISSDILKPMPSSITNRNNVVEVSEIEKTNSKQRELDWTLFEQEDDPFDNLERQTINDMEELASVLKETTKLSPASQVMHTDLTTNTTEQNCYHGNLSEFENHDFRSNSPMSENIALRMVGLKMPSVTDNSSDMVDLSKLPPVPPRRDLVGRVAPLPPNGINCVDLGLKNSLNNSVENLINSSFPGTDHTNTDLSYLIKLPKTKKYSQHQSEDTIESDCNIEPYMNTNEKSQEGKVQVHFKNARSLLDLQSDSKSNDELIFDQHHFGKDHLPGNLSLADMQGLSTSRPVPAPRKRHSPQPRPASQSWNRFNPLLPFPVNSSQDHLSDGHDTSQHITPAALRSQYSRLTEQAQASVDKLVMMGFTKDRVIRAVEKLGHDEKELVEYLCLVDKLTEKGYKTYLVENAVLMFPNDVEKVSSYLEIFTQLKELGFYDEKIKDALIRTNNDRERTLDILTASM